jgi:hypothetical protein
MPTCPKCSQPMAPARVISIAGIRDKAVSWQCPSDCIEAVAAHPVQMAHLHLGQEEESGGRRTRLIHMDMVGAELILFREIVPLSGKGGGHHG